MTHQRALLQSHLAAVLFGMTGVLGELIHSDPIMITTFRAFFAAAILFFMIRTQGRRLSEGLGKKQVGILLLASIMLTIHWISFFIAVKTGGIAIATLGFASFPAFIALSEWLILREQVDTEEWLILALVTFGLLLVTPEFDLAAEATIGLLWAVLSGLAFALFTIINRCTASCMPALQVAYWENLFVTIVCLPFALPYLGQPSAIDWFWMAILGVVCTAFSHYLLVSSLTRITARSAGIIIALEPLYAITFAALLFAQYPRAHTILGGVIMVGAIIWSGKRKQPDQS